MFNFLSSIKNDYNCAQIQSIEDHIKKLKGFISKCDQKIHDEMRDRDHYDDQITKAMEKRLDLIEMMDEAGTSSISNQHKLA